MFVLYCIVLYCIVLYCIVLDDDLPKYRSCCVSNAAPWMSAGRAEFGVSNAAPWMSAGRAELVTRPPGCRLVGPS